MYIELGVGNPYIVYGISVNKLIYREQRDDKPYIALNLIDATIHYKVSHRCADALWSKYRKYRKWPI